MGSCVSQCRGDGPVVWGDHTVWPAVSLPTTVHCLHSWDSLYSFQIFQICRWPQNSTAGFQVGECQSSDFFFDAEWLFCLLTFHPNLNSLFCVFMVCTVRSEDNLQESFLFSFLYVGPGNEIQAVLFGGKHLYLQGSSCPPYKPLSEFAKICKTTSWHLDWYFMESTEQSGKDTWQY